MAFVYYKFKISKGGFRSLPIDAPFISVYDFKAEIFASKSYGNGKDFDLLISDAKTDQLLADESLLIPAYSSVLIRRVPGLPRLPIVIDEAKPKIPAYSALRDVQETEFFDSHDLGPDPFSIRAVTSTLVRTNTHCSEEVKINGGPSKASTENSFVKGFTGGKSQIPPHGYVCHRCKVAGHYIQHCPTNSDPSFDFRKVNMSAIAVGSSKTSSSVSSSNSSGISCASASTSGSHSSIAPELYCPLCKNVMKDAALTKCCFGSFCKKCITDHVVSNSGCVCQRKIEANDIIPNKTTRETINRIVNGNRSGNFAGGCKRKVDLGETELTRKRQRVQGTYLELGQWQKMPLIKGM